MARNLSPCDLHLLKKLAPDLDSTCGHAGWEFRSVLPPLSQHVSTSPDDFKERILKLSDEELNYLVDLIFEGMESLHCIKNEHVNALVEVVGTRISKVKATELLELYKFEGE
jgi:hypothetical protein